MDSLGSDFGNQNTKRSIIELVKYGFWGAVTTALNLFAFFLLEGLGMYYITANVLSYIFAVIINYILNQKFVFKSSSQNDYKQFVKFIIVRIVSLLIDSGLFYLLVSILSFNVNLSRILLSITIIVATFGVNKLFVFNTKKR
ncbi:GtrA family protein [Paenibacillus sp. 453mf]|uniref:GtrA family protein n=1 Tax=Paenibacillus sp. 453mf TaxID=1761874 RepID=UPI0008F0BE58|nr:GtrA family protein [Paenibacillus sp. 453mf]SFS84531.1 Putative flippase GtrA (transmembrane translocase of bactoprenol-linked glucose) [Paenibacillus sp. 453mf]